MFPVGAALLPATQSVQSEWRVVSGDYFLAMQIPILRGRAFTPADNDQAPRVAIVTGAGTGLGRAYALELAKALAFIPDVVHANARGEAVAAQIIAPGCVRAVPPPP